MSFQRDTYPPEIVYYQWSRWEAYWHNLVCVHAPQTLPLILGKDMACFFAGLMEEIVCTSYSKEILECHAIDDLLGPLLWITTDYSVTQVKFILHWCFVLSSWQHVFFSLPKLTLLLSCLSSFKCIQHSQHYILISRNRQFSSNRHRKLQPFRTSWLQQATHPNYGHHPFAYWH